MAPMTTNKTVFSNFSLKSILLAVLLSPIVLFSLRIVNLDISSYPVALFLQRLVDPRTNCLKPHQTIHILSYEPLIIYFVNFITKSERKHLLSLANSRYERSQSTLHDGSLGIGDYRTSVSAALPVNDPVVECITKRAADLQGFMSQTDFEAFQVVQYTQGQKFDPHYDWYHNATQQNNTGRIASIFATLRADCSDCGTLFPHMWYDWALEDPRLCEYVDCHRRQLSVKPREGNALFWRNLHANGTGDTRTLHAGLPLPGGTKVGLNIFARTVIG